MRELGRGILEGLSDIDMGSDLFMGERGEVGEAIVEFAMEVFVHVEFGVLVGGFGLVTNHDVDVREFLMVECLVWGTEGVREGGSET